MYTEHALLFKSLGSVRFLIVLSVKCVINGVNAIPFQRHQFFYREINVLFGLANFVVFFHMLLQQLVTLEKLQHHTGSS